MEQQGFNFQASDMDYASMDIKIIFNILLRRWRIIVIFIVVFTAASFAYTMYTYIPIYSTTTSMVVNSKQTKVINQDVVYVNDIYLSRQLVDTYAVIFTSNRVIDYVISDLNLNLSSEYIRNCISITSDKNAGILYLTVKNQNPQMALNVANSIMDIAPDVISETVEVGSVKILDRAVLPQYPIQPNTVRNCALGFLVGLALGVALILVKKFFKPTILYAGEIRTKLDLTVLGSIPHVKQNKRYKKKKIPLIIQPHINLNFYEAIKSLRTNVLHIAEKQHIRTILVAGSVENDAKTTSAVNLALSLSPQYNVLLIDADMRKPSVSPALHITSNTGVPLRVLMDDFENYTKYIAVETKTKLSVLSFHADKEAYAKASDLFLSSQFKVLFEKMKKDFDYIVMDSPPAQFLADTSIIAQLVDGVILSVRQDFTPIDVIAQTRGDLLMVQAKIMGCIFSDVRYNNLEYNSRYRYHYYSRRA